MAYFGGLIKLRDGPLENAIAIGGVGGRSTNVKLTTDNYYRTLLSYKGKLSAEKLEKKKKGIKRTIINIC